MAHRTWGGPRPAGLRAKTKVVTRGVEVTVNAFYKNSRIKQYLKHGRALRIETVINSPDDLRCQRRLVHLDELQARARAVASDQGSLAGHRLLVTPDQHRRRMRAPGQAVGLQDLHHFPGTLHPGVPPG